MWTQALVIHSNKTPPKTMKTKLIHSRLTATKEEMVEMKTKKKIQLKLPRTLIGRISTRRQKQRK